VIMNNLITNNCKECGSGQNIISNGHHTCTRCGFVSEDVVLESNIYYSHENKPYSYLNNTTMGNHLERIRHQYTGRMKSMIKLDHYKDKPQSLIQTAKEEIKRLIFILRLPEKDRRFIFNVFTDFHPKIKKGTKFCNPEKLIPCIIFVFYKSHESRIISSIELINYSKISRKEFNKFMIQYRYLWAGYNMDNQSIVLQLILKVTEEYKLGMDFYYQSEKILLGLWKYISDTTEQIMAGFACSLTILCVNGYKVRVSNICEKLNISMSNISKKFKDKIAKPCKLENYKSLVKSAELIKRFLSGLSLID